MKVEVIQTTAKRYIVPVSCDWPVCMNPGVKKCRYPSNNAPRKEDVAGTAFPAALTGHNRYAHITSIRGDAVLSECFGIKKIVSEDSLRRNLLKLDPEAAHYWMSKHLKQSYEPI